MQKFWIRAVLVLTAGVVIQAQGTSAGRPTPQGGPDISGQWNRASVSGGTGSAGSSGWGARVEIVQTGANVTVQPASGKPERYRLDGTETAEVVTVKGCANQTRITQTVASRNRVTITTWLVTKSACFHGEVDDEPLVFQTGAIAVHQVLGGPRRLESITDVFREGDALTVETMRATPGGPPTTTTSTYRK